MRVTLQTLGIQNRTKFCFIISHYPDSIIKIQKPNMLFRASNTCSWKLHYLFTFSCWERRCSVEQIEKKREMVTSNIFCVSWSWTTSPTLKFTYLRKLIPLIPSHNPLTKTDGTWCCFGLLSERLLYIRDIVPRVPPETLSHFHSIKN